jgi:NADPH2:quinone reductase
MARPPPFASDNRHRGLRVRGKLRSVVGRSYQLSEIREAHRYADTGHKVGNIAVLID